MAPEMVQNKPHDYKIDIWSVGVLLYELLHGYPPFKGKTSDEKFKSILQKDIKFSPDISKEAQDLITLILNSDPARRPDFDTIFVHPWMKKHEAEFNMKIADYVYQPKRKAASKKPTVSEISTAEDPKIHANDPTKSPQSRSPLTPQQRTSPFAKLFENMPARSRSRSPVQDKSPTQSPMNRSATPTSNSSTNNEIFRNIPISQMKEPVSPNKIIETTGGFTGISPRSNSPFPSKIDFPTNPFGNKEQYQSPMNRGGATPTNFSDVNNLSRSPRADISNPTSNPPQNNLVSSPHHSRPGSYIEKDRANNVVSLETSQTQPDERRTRRTNIFGNDNSPRPDINDLMTVKSRSPSPISTTQNPPQERDKAPLSPLKGVNKAEQMVNELFKPRTPRNNDVIFDNSSVFDSSVADSTIIDNSRILDALNRSVEKPDLSSKLLNFQAELKEKQKMTISIDPHKTSSIEKKDEERQSAGDPHPMQVKQLLFDTRRKTTNDMKVTEEARLNKFAGVSQGSYVPHKSQERVNPFQKEDEKRSKSDISKPLELGQKTKPFQDLPKPMPKEVQKQPAQVDTQTNKKPLRPVSLQREGDFFVPSGNTSLMMDKPLSHIIGRKNDPDDDFEIKDSFANRNRDASPDPNIFNDKEEISPMGRVTKILESRQNKEIDELCSKIFSQETNHFSESKNRDGNNERTSNISVGGQPRITNIDKYLEDTEENQILSQLENYYARGELKPSKLKEKVNIFSPKERVDTSKSPTRHEFEFERDMEESRNTKKSSHDQPSAPTPSKDKKAVGSFGFPQDSKTNQNPRRNDLSPNKYSTEPYNQTPLEMSFQVNSQSSLDERGENSIRGPRTNQFNHSIDHVTKENNQLRSNTDKSPRLESKLDEKVEQKPGKQFRKIETFAKEESPSPAKQEMKKQHSSPTKMKLEKSLQSDSPTKDMSVDTSDMQQSIEEFFRKNDKRINRKAYYDYNMNEKVSDRDFSGPRKNQKKKASTIVQKLREETNRSKRVSSGEESESEYESRKDNREYARENIRNKSRSEREIQPRPRYVPEDQREKLLQEYKHKINALASLDNSTYVEDGNIRL